MGAAGLEHTHRTLRLAERDAVATATAVGADLIADAADLELIEAELAAGGVEGVSPEAFAIIRVEAGRPAYGAELRPETMPRRPASTSARSPSRRAATSVRRRSPGSTTGASRTGICAGFRRAGRSRPAIRSPWAIARSAPSAPPSSPRPPAGSGSAIVRRERSPGAEVLGRRRARGGRGDRRLSRERRPVGLGGKPFGADSLLLGGRGEQERHAPDPEPGPPPADDPDGDRLAELMMPKLATSRTNTELYVERLRELLPAEKPTALDDWGRSETVVSLMEPLLNFYYRYWFRVEVEGSRTCPRSAAPCSSRITPVRCPPTRR